MRQNAESGVHKREQPDTCGILHLRSGPAMIAADVTTGDC
jgi:hypothetical protein